MNLSQIKQYTAGVLKGWIPNKDTLDKFSENEEGKILYNGSEISGTADVVLSEVENNAIHKLEDGSLFVNDNTEEMQKISDVTNSISIAQKTVNTESEYCYLNLNTDITLEVGTVIPYKYTKSNNMEYDDNNATIKLKTGKTYEISADFVSLSQESNNSDVVSCEVNDITNNINLATLTKDNSTLNNINAVCVYTPETDCEIQVKVTSVSGTIVLKTGYFVAKEINRQIVIDPVGYVNKENGMVDTPVGSIIDYTSGVTPKNYLPCDGNEYNIADYPYLAQYFKDTYGKINTFGGDGITTFATPLSEKTTYAEPMTITMTSNATPSPYSVATDSVYTDHDAWKAFNNSNEDDADCWHSDAGSSHWISFNFGEITNIYGFEIFARNASPLNVVYPISRVDVQGSYDGITFEPFQSFSIDPSLWRAGSSNSSQKLMFSEMASFKVYKFVIQSTGMYAAVGEIKFLKEGTNMYSKFIKYEPTYFMNIQNTNYVQPSIYSLEERVIGSWVNGKPIYQKTIITTIPKVVTESIMVDETIDISELNIETSVNIGGVFIVKDKQISANINSNTNGEFFASAFVLGKTLVKRSNCLSWNDATMYITIQYTKTTDDENSFTPDMIYNIKDLTTEATEE